MQKNLPIYISCEAKSTALALYKREGIHGMYLNADAMEVCLDDCVSRGMEMYLSLPPVSYTHLDVYKRQIVFILLIAALVQFVEMFLKKTMPSLYQALGVYLSLIHILRANMNRLKSE